MSIMTLMHGMRTAVVAPVTGTPTFVSGVPYRSPGGTIGNRTGWTLGTLTPGNYDDSFAGPYSLPYTWYIGGVAYTTYYISTNGYITFGSGSGNIITAPQNLTGIYLTPGDNYWGTNGANGTGNSPNAIAYISGTTNFSNCTYFRLNMQGYAYGNSGVDRSWELNLILNNTTAAQYFEMVFGSALSSGASSFGIYNGSTIIQSGAAPLSNVSYCFSCTDGTGTSWTYNGAGSFSNVTFP
jgi:hypothetical protein